MNPIFLLIFDFDKLENDSPANIPNSDFFKNLFLFIINLFSYYFLKLRESKKHSILLYVKCVINYECNTELEKQTLHFANLANFIALNGGALKYADKTLWVDRKFVLEVVKMSGSILQYADSSLKADREVVFEAVKNFVDAYKYASNILKADRELLLNIVKLNGGGLGQSGGSALEYADDSLKADREVVLEAVKTWGSALKYASEELQNDSELKKLAESFDPFA